MADELAPLWQRRAVEAPGVVDTSATRRRYERTAGWALQRMARTNEMLTRYTSSGGHGMGEDLLLARLPVVAATVAGSTTEPGSLSSAPSRADVSFAAAADAALAVSPTPSPSMTPSAASMPATGMLARLQRRVEQAGVLAARSPVRTRPEISRAIRTSLTERLNARGAAPPSARGSTLLLARRLDSAPQDDEGDGAHVDAAAPTAEEPSMLTLKVATIAHPAQPMPAPSLQSKVTGRPSSDVVHSDPAPFVPLVRATPVGNPPSSQPIMQSLTRARIAQHRLASAVERKPSSITTHMTPMASGHTSVAARRAESAASVTTRQNHEATSAPRAYPGGQLNSMPSATAASGSPSAPPQTIAERPLATIARQDDEPTGDEPSVAVATRVEQTRPMHAATTPFELVAAARSLTLQGPQNAPERIAVEPRQSSARAVADAPSRDASARMPQVSATLVQRSAAADTHADAPLASSLTLHAPPKLVREHSSAIQQLPVTAANHSIAVSRAVLAPSTSHTLPRIREVTPAAGHPTAERVLSLSRTPSSPPGNEMRHPGLLGSSDLMEPLAASHAMPAVPSALLWRTSRTVMPTSEGAHPRSSAQPAAVMRAPTAAADATSATSSTQTLSAGAASMPRGTDSSALDLHSLAEHVMRLITRRLEVERDRRGGKRWR